MPGVATDKFTLAKQALPRDRQILGLEQFQEKWEPVFRPELRENKYLERITDSVKCDPL